MTAYRVVLAEDHLLLRQAIKKILQKRDELSVVGEAGDGLELLQLLELSLPDMVIIDISMPRLGGLEATRKIKELYPHVKVLILTVHKEKDYLDKAMEYGADGYVVKEDMDSELYPAIASVRRGQFYVFELLKAI